MEDHEKELLEENLRISKENNRLLRAIRRDAWFGFFFRMIFWAIVLFAPIVLYFLFQPYIETFLSVYKGVSPEGNGSGGFTMPSAEDLKALQEFLKGQQ